MNFTVFDFEQKCFQNNFVWHLIAISERYKLDSSATDRYFGTSRTRFSLTNEWDISYISGWEQAKQSTQTQQNKNKKKKRKGLVHISRQPWKTCFMFWVYNNYPTLFSFSTDSEVIYTEDQVGDQTFLKHSVFSNWSNSAHHLLLVIYWLLMTTPQNTTSK